MKKVRWGLFVSGIWLAVAAGITQAQTQDTDGDGIPDAVEQTYAFLSKTNPADAALDYDGDGRSNLLEYQQGTSLVDGPQTASPQSGQILVITIDGITVAQPMPPVGNSVSLSPSVISYDQSSTLGWAFNNATSVEITPSLGTVGASGTFALSNIKNTTTYTLTAYGTNGMTTTASATLMVDTDRDGTADEQDADDDNDGLLDTVEVANGLNQRNAADALQDADNDGFTNIDEILAGSNFQSASSLPPGRQGTYFYINVGGIDLMLPMPPNVANFTASPLVIGRGESTKIIWRLNDTTSVTISPTIGAQPTTGTATVTLLQSTTYTLVATSATGSFTQTLTIMVDTDRDGLADEVDTDDDNDRIPDTVEVANNLNPYSAADALLDKDGDGYSNLSEYLASSDMAAVSIIPQFSLAEFNSTPTAVTAAGQTVTLKWVVPGARRLQLSQGSTVLLTTTASIGSHVVKPCDPATVPQPCTAAIYTLKAAQDPNADFTAATLGMQMVSLEVPVDTLDYSKLTRQQLYENKKAQEDSITLDVDGITYMGSTNGYWFKFAADGKQLWSIKNVGLVKNKALLDEQAVYFTSSGANGDIGGVHAYDAASKKLWQMRLEVPVVVAPVLSGDKKTLYVVDVGGGVYAINKSTGATLWIAKLPAQQVVTSAPALSTQVAGTVVTDKLIVKAQSDRIFQVNCSSTSHEIVELNQLGNL